MLGDRSMGDDTCEEYNRHNVAFEICPGKLTYEGDWIDYCHDYKDNMFIFSWLGAA